MLTLTTDGLSDLLRAQHVNQPIPSIQGLDIHSSLINVYISYLAQIIVDVTSCDAQVAINAIQWPNESGMGDLVITVPRLRLQQVDLEAAVEQVSEQTARLLPLFGRPVSDGIHQRVFLNVATLARFLIPFILERGYLYGTESPETISGEVDQVSRKGKIVVEFSSPNVGKEFDGNHLRSTIHGNFVASAYEHLGHEVHRINFLGDWGKHIGILAEGWFRFGSETAFETAPLAHMLECFKKADELLKSEQSAVKQGKESINPEKADGVASLVNDSAPESQEEARHNSTDGQVSRGKPSVSEARDAFFKMLEDGEEQALELWRRFRQVSISRYALLYEQMNVRFDEYSGESDVRHDTILEVESLLKEKGFYSESEEAWIVDFKNLGFKHLGTAIARFRNGTTSYLLRDIAAVLERHRKHAFDKMLYVVSSRQETHFLQVFKAVELMGMSELAAKLQHVGFGKMTGLTPSPGADGLLLEDTLAQCGQLVESLVAGGPESAVDFHLAESSKLGAAALACQCLAAGKRSTTFAFEPDALASAEGWTGLTLHMWLRRLTARTQGLTIDIELISQPDTSYEVLSSAVYHEPLRLLLEFPHAVTTASKTMESWGLATYLYRLTDTLPDVWQELDLAESPKQAPSTLAFLECIRLVLTSGMRILGLLEQTEAMSLSLTHNRPATQVQENLGLITTQIE